MAIYETEYTSARCLVSEFCRKAKRPDGVENAKAFNREFGPAEFDVAVAV